MSADDASVEWFLNMNCLQSNPRILIADDHAFLRRGLRAFLCEFLAEDGGAPHIVETSSAHDALEKFRTASWDLVILDLNLPDMPGLEIVRTLKSLQPTAAVLVVSIYAKEYCATRAIRAGALGYLSKKAGPEELRTAVRRLLLGESPSRLPETEQTQDSGASPNALCAEALLSTLSDREIETLQWIAQGRRLTDIAEHLNLSIKTVSTYRSRLLNKLGKRTTADLIRYALDQQLV